MESKKRKLSETEKGGKGKKKGGKGSPEAKGAEGTQSKVKDFLKGLTREELIECVSEILPQMTVEELRKTASPARLKMKEFMDKMVLLANVGTYLNDEHEPFLEKAPAMIPYMALGAEMIKRRVSPRLRGQVGDLSMYVPDHVVFPFLEAIAREEGWEYKEPVDKWIRGYPFTENVTHYVVYTESEEVFRKFITSFKVPFVENVIEQHFLFNNQCDTAEPVFIPKEKLDSKSDIEILNLKEKIKHKKKWGFNTSVSIESTVMCFGDYTEPGTVTSGSVKSTLTEEQREKMGEDLHNEQEEQDDQGSKKQKPAPGKRRGKFIIEYKASAFPSCQFGILRFSFKYMILVDGKRDGN